MREDVARDALNKALSCDAAWGFYRVLSAQERQAMDDILAKEAHPLAYEPGTKWDRFQALHKAGFKF